MKSIDIHNPKTHIAVAITAVILAIVFLYAKASSMDIQQKPADEKLTVTADDHVRGNRDAEIILYEFSDFECPFCGKHHPTLQKVVDEYDGRVAWVFRHFPLSSHLNARDKAEASECVAELADNEAFWKFTDDLFESGVDTQENELSGLAEKSGIDQLTFEECLMSGKHTQTVRRHIREGRSAGVSGTPGNVLVNTRTGEQKVISGAIPYEQLKTAIDDLLEE